MVLALPVAREPKFMMIWSYLKISLLTEKSIAKSSAAELTLLLNTGVPSLIVGVIADTYTIFPALAAVVSMISEPTNVSALKLIAGLDPDVSTATLKMVTVKVD